jgi:hypothetical protein
VTVNIDTRGAVSFFINDVVIPQLIAKRLERRVWGGNHTKIIRSPSDLVRRSSDHERQVNDSISLGI